jgi:hypothetical protein
MARHTLILLQRFGTAKFALFWLLMVAVHVAHAQNQANNWYFGNHAGITFNFGSPPVALTGSAMNTDEGCSTISDGNGNLLFYTDGTTVWNRNHTEMFNGTGLFGSFSSTQSSVAVPKPGSNRFFYLFTVPAYPQNAGGLCYSLVDMQLDGGLGGIVVGEKNIMLQLDVTEKLTAVKHANNTDIWVMTHERNNNIFDAFLITSSGLNPIAVKSISGSNHGSGMSNMGYMKASPNGVHIACALHSPANFVELFDFNSSTGVVSNPIKFNNYPDPYGLEFSPNSQLMYFGTLSGGGYLYQADLSSGNSTIILASLVQVANLGLALAALQIGPDGKLYVINTYEPYLHQIHNPNSVGSVNYTVNAISLSGNYANLGLPTFIQSYFNPVPFTYKNVCFGDTTEFIPEITTGIDSVLWNFGNPASVPNDTSSLFSPVHVFTAPGTFSVSLTSWAGGVSATETQDVKINPLPQPFLGADTTLCGGNALILNAGEGYTAYLWNDGSTGKNLIVTTNGTYTVTVTDGNGCEGSDGIQVEFHEVPGAVLIKHN